MICRCDATMMFSEVSKNNYWSTWIVTWCLLRSHCVDYVVGVSVTDNSITLNVFAFALLIILVKSPIRRQLAATDAYWCAGDIMENYKCPLNGWTLLSFKMSKTFLSIALLLKLILTFITSASPPAISPRHRQSRCIHHVVHVNVSHHKSYNIGGQGMCSMMNFSVDRMFRDCWIIFRVTTVPPSSSKSGWRVSRTDGDARITVSTLLSIEHTISSRLASTCRRPQCVNPSVLFHTDCVDTWPCFCFTLRLVLNIFAERAHWLVNMLRYLGAHTVIHNVLTRSVSSHAPGIIVIYHQRVACTQTFICLRLSFCVLRHLDVSDAPVQYRDWICTICRTCTLGRDPIISSTS